MMGIETMKNVSPKTVDRSKLVQRSSIRLDPAAPREDRMPYILLKYIRLSVGWLFIFSWVFGDTLRQIN